MNPREFTDRYNELTGVFLRKFGERMQDGNIVFSSLSILSMLSLLSDATAGTTRQEVLDLLYGGLPQQGFAEQLKAVRKELTRKSQDDSGMLDYEDSFYGRPVRDSSEHFHTANAVCVRESVLESIQPGFRELLWEKYDSELYSSAVLKEALHAQLPDLVREMLPLLEEAISSDSIMAMINTVAFDAMWQYPYEDIRKGIFRNADGTESRVRMLYGEADSYVENEYGIGFVKEFQQCGYSFMALLPKEEGPEALQTLMDTVDFYDLMHHEKYAVVHTMMPEFSVSFRENMNGIMESLGVRKAFAKCADF